MGDTGGHECIAEAVIRHGQSLPEGRLGTNSSHCNSSWLVLVGVTASRGSRPHWTRGQSRSQQGEWPQEGASHGEEVVIMKLLLKDEKYSFTVTKAAEPKTEFGSGKQKMNRASQLPEWVVEVLAMDSELSGGIWRGLHRENSPRSVTGQVHLA